MKHFCILFLSAFVLFVSCSKEAVLKADLRSLKEHGYFPLHIGNEWDYGNGSMVRTDAIETIEGRAYFRFISTNGSRVDTNYYRAEGDKIFEKQRQWAEILRFDLDAKKNKPWTYKLFPEATYHYNAQLRDKNASIETDNFEFKNCLEFYFNSPKVGDSEHEIFLAKGIGIIATRGAWRRPGLDPALQRIIIDGIEVVF